MPVAVRIALVVAEAVEKHVRRSGIARRPYRQRRVMTTHARRDQLVRRHRLAREHNFDQRVGVPAERDRSSQRDLLVGHAADDRVLRVEVQREQERLREHAPRDAASRVLRFELAAGQESRRNLAAQLHVVEAALLEEEEPRDVLVDDVNLDGAGLRDALAVHTREDRRIRRIVALREVRLAILRVRFEDEPRAALPLLEAVRPGANGPRPDVAASRLYDLPRRRADEAKDVANVRIVRLAHTDLQRVAVERTQAFDQSIEVEFAGLLRSVDHWPRAEDQIGENR